ncbi:hypothetical protein JXO52_06435 [bacterium]|nr:hypothetical protein [bacterium]
MENNATVLEHDCAMTMVDFYKEADYIISLGLARAKPDINTINWYRITGKVPDAANPAHRLQLRSARIICDGKMYGLCEGRVTVTNPLQPSEDGHLLLGMKGPLDALSKCTVSCTCGTAFMVCADATVGRPEECYLRIETLRQPPEAKFSIRPFFETAGVDIIA